MNRIRNRLRFQSPEERVLNGLLLVLLGVLCVVGVSKWRDDHAVGATEVRGIQITHPASPRVIASTSTSSTTTTTTPGPDPQLVWYLVAGAARSGATPKTAPSSDAPFSGFPPSPSTSTTTTRPTRTTTTTTTRPVTTTTTTRPVTTTTTTTTTQPRLVG